MSAPMRHRLFHAIVMVGAALPACAAETTEPAPAQDSGAAQDTSMWSGDALLTSDTSVADTSAADTSKADTTVVDTGAADTGAVMDAGPDVCDGGCGSSCFPCIK